MLLLSLFERFQGCFHHTFHIIYVEVNAFLSKVGYIETLQEVVIESRRFLWQTERLTGFAVFVHITEIGFAV